MTSFVRFVAFGLLVLIALCVINAVAKNPPKMRALRGVPVKCLGVLMLFATAIGMLAVPKNPMNMQVSQYANIRSGIAAGGLVSVPDNGLVPRQALPL